MLHFNRRTEYALLAIEHMIRRSESGEPVTSTREIADAFRIPYPLLGKVLQKLSGKGIVKSVHGTKGGYVLAKDPKDISLASVLEIFEGPLAVAECFREERITCPQWEGCLIKNPLYEINHKIYDLLTHTTIADLSHGKERSVVQETL